MKEPNPAWVNYFDEAELLVAATRYYMGRMTASNIGFAADLASAWPLIPDPIRKIIKHDLQTEFRRDDEARAEGKQWKPLGADCDREAWERVRKAWIAYEATKQMR